MPNELSETVDRACMVITEASLTILALRAEVDQLREGLFTIARAHPETRDTVTRILGA